MNLLIKYLIFSESIAVVALGFVLFDKNTPQFALLPGQTKPKNLTEVIVTILKYVLLAPVIAPYLALKESRAGTEAKAEMERRKKVRRSYHPLLLDPLTPREIPTNLWVHLEEQTAAICEFHFQCLGDFRTKAEPAPGQARYFLSQNGASLMSIGDILGTQFSEISTFLDDGAVVVTVNVAPIDSMKKLAKQRYFVQCLPGLETTELFERHEEFVAATCRRESAVIRKLEEETWQDYAHYNNLRFGHINYQFGQLDAPPPTCEFPPRETSRLISPSMSETASY